jgi:hypothetical protein
MKKSIFIHIPKCGGSNFWSDLNRKQLDSNNEVLYPDWNHLTFDQKYLTEQLRLVDNVRADENIGHVRLSDWKQDLINEYKPFGIVRNPWSRAFAQYKNFMNDSGPHARGADSNKLRAQDIQNRRTVRKKYNIESFEKWMKVTFELYNEVPYTWLSAHENWWSQKSYLVDTNDNFVSDVLRLENYDNDVKKYFSVQFHKTNVAKDSTKYTEVYDDRLIQFVADVMKEDIDFFGFDFDTSATKNLWKEIL